MATHPSDFPGFGVSVCSGGAAMTWAYAIAAFLVGGFLGWRGAWWIARLMLAEQGRRLVVAKAERDAAFAGIQSEMETRSKGTDQ